MTVLFKECTILFVFFSILVLLLDETATFNYHPSSISSTHSILETCSCRRFIGTDDGNPAFTAITVDTRFGPPLIFSIRHMSCSLPDDWIIMLIAHVSMRDDILAEFEDLLKIGKLRIWELSSTARGLNELCPDFENNNWCEFRAQSKNVTDIVDNSIDSSSWPLDWKLSNEIWFSENVLQAIQTTYFLIFQTDGLLCKPLIPEYLKELLRYDYVGAPWPQGVPWANYKIDGSGVGGNGGFSFRNRDVMLRILQPFIGQRIEQNEDTFFSNHVYNAGGALPPIDFARSFSVESVPYDNPLAFHKPWIHIFDKNFTVLVENCPAINESLTWAKCNSSCSSTLHIQSCRNKPNRKVVESPKLAHSS